MRLREGTAWFVVLTGFYFALISEYDWPEIATGTGAGALGAAAAVLSSTAERGRFRLAWRWLAWLGPLPLTVLGDTGRLTVLLLRHILTGGLNPVRGQLRELRLPLPEDAARATALRALGSLTLSFAPGSYVVDVDADTGVVLLNNLGAAESSRLNELLTR